MDAIKYIKEDDLINIPNVGPAIKKDLVDIGIHSKSDLKNKDPKAIYDEVCKSKGFIEDRCLLYVFRMAVYYANNETHDKEKLKWWYWKDKDDLND